MEHYLIDNNVISSYFAGLFSEKAVAFMANVIDQIPNLSVITEIEALADQAYQPAYIAFCKCTLQYIVLSSCLSRNSHPPFWKILQDKKRGNSDYNDRISVYYIGKRPPKLKKHGYKPFNTVRFGLDLLIDISMGKFVDIRTDFYKKIKPLLITISQYLDRIKIFVV